MNKKKINDALFAELTVEQQNSLSEKIYVKDSSPKENLAFDESYTKRCYQRILESLSIYIYQDGDLMNEDLSLKQINEAYKHLQSMACHKHKVYKSKDQSEKELQQKIQATEFDYELKIAIKKAAAKLICML